jgi:hypothetical protein
LAVADQATWFDGFGACHCGCGKPATGKLMGSRNESLGAYTAGCAAKRIKRAQQEREKEKAVQMRAART